MFVMYMLILKFRNANKKLFTSVELLFPNRERLHKRKVKEKRIQNSSFGDHVSIIIGPYMGFVCHIVTSNGSQTQ